jgi:hypothetical protein
LDILRQLEKMKQMTACDLGSDEEVNEVNWAERKRMQIFVGHR